MTKTTANEMRVMGKPGDTRVAWDPANTEEVRHARQMFDDLVRDKRYAAFRIAEPGARGERITRFDPDAREILMVPPVAGG
jgi:hypothetical protein